MGSQVALVKGNRQMGFQVDQATHSLVLVKGGHQMGSQVALVKGNRQMGFQVDLATHSLVLVKGGRQMRSQVALVKGNCQMGFQVDRATPIFWFWIKEVARWDRMLLWLKGITR